MLRIRVIPCLLLHAEALVKTIKFGKFNYIGDPANTCRIFNELEVDELCFLDILASREGREPNYKLLSVIANECFMPLSYGGGVASIAMAERILKLGFEKIVLNSYALENPSLILQIAKVFGNQSVVVSIDVKRNFLGKSYCWGRSGTDKYKKKPIEWAKEIESLGGGEILLTSIEREGTWNGYDLELLEKVSSAVSIPVIAHGGAGSVEHLSAAVTIGKASAVAAGSLFVYQGKNKGVLINYPNDEIRHKLHEIC